MLSFQYFVLFQLCSKVLMLDLCLVVKRLKYPVGFAVAVIVAKNAGKDFSDPALASDLLQFF